MAKIPSGSPSDEAKPQPLPNLGALVQVPPAEELKLISLTKLPFDPSALCGHLAGINAMGDMMRKQMLALRIDMDKFSSCPDTLDFVISDLITALARFRMIGNRLCGTGADENTQPKIG